MRASVSETDSVTGEQVWRKASKLLADVAVFYWCCSNRWTTAICSVVVVTQIWRKKLSYRICVIYVDIEFTDTCRLNIIHIRVKTQSNFYRCNKVILTYTNCSSLIRLGTVISISIMKCETCDPYPNKFSNLYIGKVMYLNIFMLSDTLVYKSHNMYMSMYITSLLFPCFG